MAHLHRKDTCGIVCRLIAGLGLLVSLGGCLDFSFLAPKEPVTLTCVAEGAHFERLVEDFQEAYPHITVELVGWRRAFSGDAAADTWVGSNFQISFMQGEADASFASLNELMVQDDDFDLQDFYPAAVNTLSRDGERLGLPIGIDMVVMRYNRDLFTQQQVPPPTVDWTWNDFLERASRLSDPGQGQFGYAYHFMGNLSVMEPMLWARQHGGGFFDDLSNPSQVTFSRPENVEAMQWYADLINAHHVAPRGGERAFPYPDEGIESGKYAMWMGWISEEWEGVDAGVAPLPRNLSAATTGTVYGAFISSETLHPEASWTWAKFLSRQHAPGLMPARRSLMEAAAEDGSMDAETLAAAQASLPAMVPFQFDLSGEFGSTWGQVMQGLGTALNEIRNGEPVAAALDAAEDEALR